MSRVLMGTTSEPCWSVIDTWLPPPLAVIRVPQIPLSGMIHGAPQKLPLTVASQKRWPLPPTLVWGFSFCINAPRAGKMGLGHQANTSSNPEPTNAELCYLWVTHETSLSLFSPWNNGGTCFAHMLELTMSNDPWDTLRILQDPLHHLHQWRRLCLW